MTKRPTRIYFIKPVGLDGPIKIGCSENPPGRLMSLMVWSPWPLEIIGSVPGVFADEGFLHSCFADLHSHREWFKSSPLLRSTIEAVIEAGSVDHVRNVLKPVASIKNKRLLSNDSRRHRSYAARARYAVRRLRSDIPAELVYYSESERIEQILREWNGRIDREGNRARRPPSEEDINHLEAFISDPIGNGAIKHVIPRRTAA